jgi:GNAT superfamily N-acetyltransferase
MANISDPDGSGFEVRHARPEDRPTIVRLCGEALGWDKDDPNTEFFTWKHDENAFGTSPAWVAVDAAGQLVGVRYFMRWRFRDADGSVIDAVRGVELATRPDARGKGVFRQLTLGALPELKAQGTGFVFNTPNEVARSGYLKMGWSLIGRVPLGIQPGRLSVNLRKSSATWTGASKWGVPTSVGISPTEAFADDDAVAALLRSLPARSALETDRTLEFLRWRYSFEPLHYRVFPVGDSLTDGVIVFRLCQRGARLDATICEELLPRPRVVDPIYRSLARATGADLLLRTQVARFGRGPFIRVGGPGPILTWLPLDRPGVPGLGELALSSGDLELF